MVALRPMSKPSPSTDPALSWPIRGLLRGLPVTAGPWLGARWAGPPGPWVPLLPRAPGARATGDPLADPTLLAEARRIDGASRALFATFERWDPRRLCRRCHLAGLEELSRTADPTTTPRPVLVAALPAGREALVAKLLGLFTTAPTHRIEDLQQEPGTCLEPLSEGIQQEPGTYSEPSFNGARQEPGTWVASLDWVAEHGAAAGLPVVVAVVWVTPGAEVFLRLATVELGSSADRRSTLLGATTGLLALADEPALAAWPWHRARPS